MTVQLPLPDRGRNFFTRTKNIVSPKRTLFCGF
jgi:hypothetical protein